MPLTLNLFASLLLRCDFSIWQYTLIEWWLHIYLNFSCAGTTYIDLSAYGAQVYPNSVSRKNYTFLSTRTTKRLRRWERQPKYPRLLIAINKGKMGFSRTDDTMESVQSNFSQFSFLCIFFLSFYSAIHVHRHKRSNAPTLWYIWRG